MSGESILTIWDYFTIAFFVLALTFLIMSIVFFFNFKIPQLIKNTAGSLELKQIEEIRRNNSAAANQRGKVNVFEELEKKAKVKKVNTHSLNVGPTTGFPAHTGGNEGTSVLRSGPAVSHPGFVIEKNIMFVSTNEVM